MSENSHEIDELPQLKPINIFETKETIINKTDFHLLCKSVFSIEILFILRYNIELIFKEIQGDLNNYETRYGRTSKRW